MNPNGQSPTTHRIAQAAVVPFRRDGDGVTFCLITSLKRKRWIFPKGIIDPGETLEQTALKEAYEEAGLRGRIQGRPLGTYQDFKWGARLDVTVLLMEVHHCEENWPEADLRQRRWTDAAEAMDLLDKPELQSMLARAADRTPT